jgi:hypothetical protein
MTEIGIPDPFEPEIEVVPTFDPVPSTIDLPLPAVEPAREPELVPA